VSGDVTPLIPDFGTTRGSAVSFTRRALYSRYPLKTLQGTW